MAFPIGGAHVSSSEVLVISDTCRLDTLEGSEREKEDNYETDATSLFTDNDSSYNLTGVRCGSNLPLLI